MNLIYGRFQLYATIHAFKDLPPSRFRERALCGKSGVLAEAGPEIPAHLAHLLCRACAQEVRGRPIATLHADRDLDPKTAEALGTMIRLASEAAERGEL